MEKTADNKKYGNILQTARDLFWKHGFRRVSVEEICKKAGVSKMTFYRFFPNKLDLAKSVFDREVEKGIQQFRAIMEEKSSPAEKIKKMIRMKLDGTSDISREFLVDFYNGPDPELTSYIEEKTKSAWVIVMNDFKKAQQKGWIRKDMKPEFFFYLAQKLGEIYNDPKITGLYNNTQDFIRETVNFFMYGIAPHD